MEIYAADGSVMLFEAVYQGSHTVVP